MGRSLPPIPASVYAHTQIDPLEKQILNEFKDFKDYVKNNGDRREGSIEKKRNDKLSIWKKIAEAGIAEGQILYGLYFIDAKKNDAEGTKWLRKATGQGNAEGQWRLGFSYEYGYGVSKDVVEAVKWYHKAAEQG
jgi:TPR repeat protein